MAVLMIGAEQEQAASALIALARQEPISREYLQRMSAGFDPADPSTRNPDAAIIPLDFTIDIPVGFRVTYTEEDQPVGLCRHLSVSIDRPERLPAPPAVEALLVLFRFERPLSRVITWTEQYGSGRVAINAIEPIGPAAEVAR